MKIFSPNISCFFFLSSIVVLWIMASMPFGMHAVQKVRANMSLAANATNSGSGKWQKDNTANHKFTNIDQRKCLTVFSKGIHLLT